MPLINIADRIVDFRRVPGTELLANPANPRTHPSAQVDALTGVLEEIGIVGAVVARETPAGLQLLDGHLRVELLPYQMVPVLVVDLSDAEADVVLASYDQITTQAKLDPKLYATLLERVQPRTEAVSGFLQRFASKLPPPRFAGSDLDEDETDYEADLDAPSSEAEAAAVVSAVRMVQLFYTQETQPQFIQMCDRLAAIYGTDTLSATVWQAVIRADRAARVQVEA